MFQVTLLDRPVPLVNRRRSENQRLHVPVELQVQVTLGQFSTRMPEKAVQESILSAVSGEVCVWAWYLAVGRFLGCGDRAKC